jgi:hypothetical protein
LKACGKKPFLRKKESKRSKEAELLEEQKIFRGVEAAANISMKTFANAEIFFYAVSDWKAPSLAVELELYRNCYLDMKRRGVKVKVITEIRNENLSYCKQILSLGLVSELRHMGSRGNFAVTEKEYIAASTIKETSPAQEVIYSNDREIVEQNQYVFDMLWSKATSAELRIR